MRIIAKCDKRATRVVKRSNCQGRSSHIGVFCDELRCMRLKNDAVRTYIMIRKERMLNAFTVCQWFSIQNGRGSTVRGAAINV